MHIFYTPDIFITNELPEDESLHCVKVLRLTEGTEIRLTDGKGSFFRAKIARAHPKRCAVEILETFSESYVRNFSINIAIAPTKNLDRIEWMAEKMTEIGIDRISFIRCRYSERKELKEERIKKILVSAMKQSLKATLPWLEGLMEFSDIVKQSFEGRKFIAHCYANQPRKMLSKEYSKGENALILIGPEGDFSEEEVALAVSNGFEPISLGESRLRTETAAVVACHTLHVLNSL
ncbi:MAG: 16S rRNA (uracil(1498)-N(3))-methyltransferase [Bacteroidales bacterium]|nr:16S rRNA (uracil(1498)-N(3))-methyltransferase [Bacteroidales bacterium]